jgi:hypothetical protein
VTPPPLKLEWPADLVQVESKADKVRAVAEQMRNETPPPRPQRVRPAPPVSSTEPLVQVETRGGESRQETAGEHS